MVDTKAWITAFRLRTLPLAFSGWMVGSVLALSNGAFQGNIASLTLLTAFLLQILSNLANDYGDAVSGVDSMHRTGPDRMVQTGAITKESMKRAMILFSFLSLISGSILIYLAFPNDYVTAGIFLLIGLAGIGAAIKYTVGNNPYGYAGFGDVFVFLFFGWVLVFGTYFLQVGSWDWEIVLPATSIGFFSVGVLNVNNIRDIESDKRSGKFSIPVRLGKKKAIAYHIFLLEGGLAASIIYVFMNFDHWGQLLFVFINVIFIRNIKALQLKPASQLDPHLKQMAIATLLFALLFSAGHLIDWFF